MHTVTWVAWASTKPFMHVMTVELPDRFYWKYVEILRRIGLSEAYRYAWLRGRNKEDVAVDW